MKAPCEPPVTRGCRFGLSSRLLQMLAGVHDQSLRFQGQQHSAIVSASGECPRMLDCVGKSVCLDGHDRPPRLVCCPFTYTNPHAAVMTPPIPLRQLVATGPGVSGRIVFIMASVRI